MLIVDGHVHIYPHYDLNLTIKKGIENLKAASGILSGNGQDETFGDVCFIWLLAERYDCDFIGDVINKRFILQDNESELVPGDEIGTVEVKKNGKAFLYILGGRQIVTKEGLEVLSIASSQMVNDGEKTIDEVLKIISDSGGVSVINWAPGKWFFKRGEVVKRIIDEHSPTNIMFCDTSLRHNLWPMPRLMAEAKKRGFKIMAGSDPLPISGEENFVGCYGFRLEGEFDPGRAAGSVKSLLRQSNINMPLIGKRNNVLAFCRRQFNLKFKTKV